MSDIVQKLWGFCHVLRHDGVDYGDYIEQLTYLLFLKMAEERGAVIPRGCEWASLRKHAGTALTDHYADILRKLREAPGMLGDIFTQATPRFSNPVNLKRVIAMIDEEDWSAMDVDVKGAAFEGLLEKAASEGKKGAGQYFTPRVLIQSIVRVMKPDPRGKPDFKMCDPATGTGGFIVCSYEWLIAHVWIFDARSNVPGITKKDRPLTAQHFVEFEKCYGADPNGMSKRKDLGEAGRFRKFSLAEIKERGYKLDITWLKDESLEDSDQLPEPQDLAGDAITELEAVVDDLREIVRLVEREEGVDL